MITRRAAVAASLFAGLAGQAVAQTTPPIVGTWRLVSFDREVLETKAVSHAFGGHAVGLLTYTSDGRMMAIIVDSMRKPPARPTPTDAEALGLYRSMLAYAGTYSIQGNEIINHVEISWNPTLTGTDQKRFFKLEGDRLTFTTPPLVSAFLKKSDHCLDAGMGAGKVIAE